MSVIPALFQNITDIVTEFGVVFTDLFTNITGIFFTSDGSGGTVLTEIGQLSLCVFGIGLIWTGIRWLSRLIKMRG